MSTLVGMDEFKFKFNHLGLIVCQIMIFYDNMLDMSRKQFVDSPNFKS